jgi:hypothetical protein
VTLLSAPDASAAESLQNPEALVKGRPVEKALSVGETHLYQVNADADRVVRLQLEKMGVAAAVTVFAPDGESLESFGSTTSGQGAEQITFPTGKAGNYRVSVRTYFKPSPPGRYRITLVEVRSATDRDRIGRNRQSCQEKSWLDSENRFLVNEALDAISGCLSAVGQRLQERQPKAATLAGKAAADLHYLKGRWHWEAVSPVYRESLLQDFRALASAAGDPNAKRAAKMLGRVAKDIGIKAEHCRKSNQGLGPRIEVQVVTKRGIQEEKGWFVFYKSFLYEDQTGFAKRFPQQSSPTTIEMAPARYFFWLAPRDDDPEPPQNKQKAITVGEGFENRHLDLSVP